MSLVGVGLVELRSQLKEWKASLPGVVQRLEGFRKEIVKEEEEEEEFLTETIEWREDSPSPIDQDTLPHGPQKGTSEYEDNLEFADLFIDLFGRWSTDFACVIQGCSKDLKKEHIYSLHQLHKSCQSAREDVRSFRQLSLPEQEGSISRSAREVSSLVRELLIEFNEYLGLVVERLSLFLGQGVDKRARAKGYVRNQVMTVICREKEKGSSYVQILEALDAAGNGLMYDSLIRKYQGENREIKCWKDIAKPEHRNHRKRFEKWLSV